MGIDHADKFPRQGGVYEHTFDKIGCMAGGLLDRLTEALDGLADLDVDVLDEAELHDAVTTTGGLTSRLEALWCRLIASWDRRQLWADNGSKSPGARLARETHRRRGDCDRLVRRAATSTRCRQRRRRTPPARSPAPTSTSSPRATASGATPTSLTPNSSSSTCAAPRRSPSPTEQSSTGSSSPTATPPTATPTACAGTALSASVAGTATRHRRRPRPLGGEIVKTQLDRICEQLRLRGPARGVTRTATQRRADALVEMATRGATAPANGLRPRPLLTVTIGIDPFNHLCQTATGTVIAPGLLIPYLSDADIERIVYDPPNRRLEASVRRTFTGALRQIIEVRDEHCQHPSGCDEPAARCDIDHIIPHSHGGITCLCNGQLLCPTTTASSKPPPTKQPAPAALDRRDPPLPLPPPPHRRPTRHRHQRQQRHRPQPNTTRNPLT